MLIREQYNIERKTDRDLELPVLFEFLERTKGTIASCIDVGAHYSKRYYAEHMRLYVDFYDALDPNIDDEVVPIVDRFLQEDAETHDFDQYDLVMCLSTIEHVGMYPVKAVDYKVKRRNIIEKLIKAADKYLWISFPVGAPYIDPGEMAIVDRGELDDWMQLMRFCKVTAGFFKSEGPQAGFPWKACSMEDIIDKPYVKSLGTCGLCVLEVQK
jgi:hypothetical protein